MDMELYYLIPVSLLVTILASIVILLYRHYTTLSRYGIPGPVPLPLLGNLHQTVKLVKPSKVTLDVITLYINPCHAEPGIFRFCKRYYQGMRPNVAVTDPELIKKILVKNFTNFSNRPSVGNVPKLIGESIFFMKDRLWKRTRNIITPTFSSGKLKNMVPIINRCAGLLTDNLLGHEGESVVVRKYFGQFTMDTITATAFGLEINSQKDPDNPFLKHMTGILTPSLLGRMGFILSAMFPGIGQVLIKIGISGWPKESVAFYTDTGKRLIDERKSSTTEYNDFMYLLINAEMDETKSEHIQNGYKIGSLEEKGKIMKLSDDEIISQSFLFFIAGYETTSSLLRYAAYILATKPEIDDKLYDEINEYIGMDEPTYDNIGKLKYMEQFIYETLRFYPPAPRLNRVAQEDIDLDGKIIPKGSTIAIPVYGIHHNEEYYPDPETFDPERFPPDKKISTDSTTFLAFGAGPRHCIGTRLAIIEAKIALVHLLRKMKFVKSERTQEKLELTHLGLLRPTQPIEVKIDKR